MKTRKFHLNLNFQQSHTCFPQAAICRPIELGLAYSYQLEHLLLPLQKQVSDWDSVNSESWWVPEVIRMSKFCTKHDFWQIYICFLQATICSPIEQGLAHLYQLEHLLRASWSSFQIVIQLIEFVMVERDIKSFNFIRFWKIKGLMWVPAFIHQSATCLDPALWDPSWPLTCHGGFQVIDKQRRVFPSNQESCTGSGWTILNQAIPLPFVRWQDVDCSTCKSLTRHGSAP